MLINFEGKARISFTVGRCKETGSNNFHGRAVQTLQAKQFCEAFQEFLL
jgi:hypothetical protein